MPARDPVDRAKIASIGGHAKWAREPDPVAATEPARRAFNDRFEREVDPDGTLPEATRARMAEHARKLYFKQLARRSAAARRARKASGGAA